MNSNKEEQLEHKINKNNTSIFLSKRCVNFLYGIIFVLIGIIGFLNKSVVGEIVLYGVSYVFGSFAYLFLAVLVLLGLYLVFKGYWPKFRISFTGLAIIFIFLFGTLASTMSVEGLSFTTYLSSFNTKFGLISKGLIINSITDIPSLNGGFIGYFLSSLFVSGLGVIGTYVFTYLFLIFGSALLIRKPCIYFYHFIQKQNDNAKIKKAQSKANTTDKKVEPIEVKKEDTSTYSPNPFKEKNTIFVEKKEVPLSNKADNQENDVEDDDDVEESPFNKNRNYVPLSQSGVNSQSISQQASSPFKSTTSILPSKEEVLREYNTPSFEESKKEVIEEVINEEPLVQMKRTFEVDKPDYLKVEEEEEVETVVDDIDRHVQERKSPVNSTPTPHIFSSGIQSVAQTNNNYVLPSISLLVKRQDFGKFEQNQRDAENKITVINSVFKNFDIRASVQSFTIGPTVTRFNIAREQGVKVNQIAGLSEEMQIALKGDMSVRIEPVVRGQDTSGIEVANVAPTMVSFYDCYAQLLKHPEQKLLIPLGEDISSEVITTSIDSLPHMLVSGTTGSGKSVFIHSILLTLIMRNYPNELKLILIDPKKVEFIRYTNIPHLYCPIIDDALRAVATLKKLVAEMERRYSLLSLCGASKLEEYNEMRKTSPDLEELPNLICVIDEFADLMMQAPKDVDILTQRLAQKGRASGIYLIIATQRPTVNCITGTIKANIPTRIALSVSSSLDSRTILDENGAESLVGRGDLLARVPQYKQLIRLQSAYVSNEEITAVVNYLKAQSKPCFNPEFLNFEKTAQDAFSSADDSYHGNGDDELFEDVKSFVIQNRVASTSQLQKVFKIGYGRASGILDALEDQGVIKTVGNGRREVVQMDDEEL